MQKYSANWVTWLCCQSWPQLSTCTSGCCRRGRDTRERGSALWTRPWNCHHTPLHRHTQMSSKQQSHKTGNAATCTQKQMSMWRNKKKPTSCQGPQWGLMSNSWSSAENEQLTGNRTATMTSCLSRETHRGKTCFVVSMPPNDAIN